MRNPNRQQLHVAVWLNAVLLAVIATVLIVDRDDREAASAAYAQGVAAPLGARGIYMFPGQLSPSSYGLFMLDVDAGTLWCYEYVAAERKLRLAAARSWIFDRYLEEYNIKDITPAEVGELVEIQRSQRSRLQEVLDVAPSVPEPESP
jgi:hypothetical protein